MVLGVSSTSATLYQQLSLLPEVTLGGNLTVNGRTTLSDVGITGNITIGLLSINGIDTICDTSDISDTSDTFDTFDTSDTCANGASINTLGGDLKLQPLALGGINILNGKVTIDTMGNITIVENAVFKKNVTVDGVLSANNIATKQITLTQQAGIVDLSANESISSSSAGTATIKTGETRRKILTPLVKKDSLIYITAVSNPSNQYPFILEQQDNEYFTVGIKTALTQDLKLNFLILNTTKD